MSDFVKKADERFNSQQEVDVSLDPYYESSDVAENEDGEPRARGPLLNLAFHKLSIFLTLKFEEQLAVTGLIERCVCILSAMVVVAPPSERTYTEAPNRDRFRLKAILELHNRINALWTEVGLHLYRLPSAIEKLDALKQALRAKRPDLERQQVLKGEAPHHAKLLETGVVVRELLLELRGNLLAIKRLRASLGDFDATRGTAERAATRSDAASSAMNEGGNDDDVEGKEEARKATTRRL